MTRTEMQKLSLWARRRVHWAQALIVLGVLCVAPLAYFSVGSGRDLDDVVPLWAARAIALCGLLMPIIGLWLLLGILRGYLKRDEILIEGMSGERRVS